MTIWQTGADDEKLWADFEITNSSGDKETTFVFFTHREKSSICMKYILNSASPEDIFSTQKT